jgi:hypothetical protein
LFSLRDGAPFAPVDGGVSRLVDGDAMPAPEAGTKAVSTTSNASEIADDPPRLRGTLFSTPH